MRNVKRMIVLWFLALVVGATVGSIKDDLDPSLKMSQAQAEQMQEEKACLREALYYEGRGGLEGAQIMEGMVILARIADPDREWPKSICGVVHQVVHGKPQFSYWMDEKVFMRPINAVEWARANEVADYLLAKAWVWQVLPKGAACVRSFKVLNKKLATMPEKAIKQLHVSVRSLGYFNRTQKLVFTVGDTGFYEDKLPCKHPLPTM